MANATINAYPAATTGASPNTTKGDVAGYDTASARIPVGADATVLTADSTQALGVKWAAAAAGVTTTKGDIAGYSTLSARIPVGSDNQVLTADSTQALGLKWATPTGVNTVATGAQTITTTTALTNVAVDVLGQTHRTSGTPAATFGISNTWQLDSSTNVLRTAAMVGSAWTTATNASEAADFRLALMSGGVAPTLAAAQHIWLPGSYTTTGWIKTGSGSAANPALAIGENSGFYRLGAQDIGFSFNGSGPIIEFYASNYVDFHACRLGVGTGTTSIASINDRGELNSGVNAAGSSRWDCQARGSVIVSWSNVGGAAPKFSMFAATPVVQQTVGANVNNVAASGTTGQFDDFTNGTVYATDYPALHATIYQLTRSVAQLTVAARNYGYGA